ncbi:MAG: alkaline phosphatase family protein [Acidobacteriia bacterium]|nr:alkaline phosphatase family protein [Terriglobia bacterium]
MFALAVFSSSGLTSAQEVGKHKTQNILFVMTDGLRWQEVFRGAELDLLEKSSTDADAVAALKKKYWRETPEERRQILMPFFWAVIAGHGQIYGNRDKGSDAHVTNKLNFSYPGYSETLCGFADPRINSNDKIPNPNVTVLEWLAKKPAYKNRVAAFAAWDVFPSILNEERAGLTINAGYDPFPDLEGNARIELLNTLKKEIPHYWDEEPFDALPFHTALEYLKGRKPRILFLSLGETDDWAHGSNYLQYLDAAHRADEFLRILWDAVQSMPQYRGRTTLVFSTDHGRGMSATTWNDHGEEIPESKYIWMAFLGPDTAAFGERTKVSAVTQNQIAATTAAFLGEDYIHGVRQAGPPIVDVLATQH